ncbi:glycoside hydrolase [Flagellimonas pacifica]|uniref:Glycosyl hydrolases related to GH101 family, GHL1-GHL3 n=1 Tax=Flagellimonas pacifica TaxID=1247520 RepID=A0A285MX48_9FLAO|nr:glycoside hydrolase [Allomuricauda parva]SNZ01752.1 Glycosyl hydrolases related to GH101 family, GHL1-GHL3 [Allomuricauda parva]
MLFHLKSFFLIPWLCSILIISCGQPNKNTQSNNDLSLFNENFRIQVDPETFTVKIEKGDTFERYLSYSEEKMEVENLEANEKSINWEVPSKSLSINLAIYDDYLDVHIASSETGNFEWPVIDRGEHEAFTIPIEQGKYIPADDPQWISFMTGHGNLIGTRDLSMQMFGVNQGKYATVYIIKNIFNNELVFNETKGSLSLKFNHHFPSTVSDKNYGYRIYLADNNPTAIAKTYQAYVEETGSIVTLEEKAEKNSDIRKLYGAPHIYVWGDEFLIQQNVKNWRKLKAFFLKELASPKMNPTKHIFELFGASEAETGKEFRDVLDELKNDEYVYKYHKLLWINAWNEVLLRHDFYDENNWGNVPLSAKGQSLIKKGVGNLDDSEIFQLNKAALSAAYSNFLDPVSQWGNGVSEYLLNEFQNTGINKAWIGLDSWLPGEIHPDFVAKSNALGYLIAPYDSYHSIHEPGKERWITAKFVDTTLYENATITEVDGSKIAGFLQRGRLLNPTLSMPTVKNRVNRIMGQDVNFNSWFIDCDATGYFYDDYTPGRMSNQSQDMNARLERMAWIRDNHDLVIGSEDGNDYSAPVIAYAHGMTTPPVAWEDPDLRQNKESEYFVGNYFSRTGGVPERYAKQVPMKDKHTYVYFDNRFNIPLFQLVYNNSVITSHHWEWGTLKVIPEIQNQELKEVLYNVPPLYQLDIPNWKQHKKVITDHVKVFSKLHEQAVKMEMTSFDWLTEDRLIQKTVFGDNKIQIIANFGPTTFDYEGKEISAKSLLVVYPEKDTFEFYKPL